MNVKIKDVKKEENNKQCLRIICSLLPVLLIFCVNVILSEVALGETLEGQLDRIGGLSTGKLKTIGISGATILSSIWAVVRGNLRLAGAIVAIGIILGFYLEWVSSGMKIS